MEIRWLGRPANFKGFSSRCWGRTSGCNPSAQLAGNGWRLFLSRQSFQCYFALKTQISNLIPQGWTKFNT